MKAIYWKELRELATVIAPLCGIALGISFVGELGERVVEASPSLSILTGILLGAVQGGFDRRRRDDLFLLHRPLARWKLHLARTLAGATAVVVPVVLMLLFWLVRFLIDYPRFRVDYMAHLGQGRIGLVSFHAPSSLWLLGSILGAWAVVRLALSLRSARWVVPCLLALPIAFAALVYRGDGPWTLFGAVFGGVLVFSTASVVTLTEGR